VAGLPVFGSYPIADPDRALAMLETVMPIRVRRRLPWWTSIEPAGKPSR
jgi:transmembrane sensor